MMRAHFGKRTAKAWHCGSTIELLDFSLITKLPPGDISRPQQQDPKLACKKWL
jgi:hypothetical protein